MMGLEAGIDDRRCVWILLEPGTGRPIRILHSHEEAVSAAAALPLLRGEEFPELVELTMDEVPCGAV